MRRSPTTPQTPPASTPGPTRPQGPGVRRLAWCCSGHRRWSRNANRRPPGREADLARAQQDRPQRPLHPGLGVHRPGHRQGSPRRRGRRRRGDRPVPSPDHPNRRAVSDLGSGATHAIGNAGIKNALRARIDSIEHGFYLDDEALDLAVTTGRSSSRHCWPSAKSPRTGSPAASPTGWCARLSTRRTSSGRASRRP